MKKITGCRMTSGASSVIVAHLPSTHVMAEKLRKSTGLERFTFEVWSGGIWEPRSTWEYSKATGRFVLVGEASRK